MDEVGGTTELTTASIAAVPEPPNCTVVYDVGSATILVSLFVIYSNQFHKAL
jgi:hypothetical protein